MKKFKFKINGSEYEVLVKEKERNIAEIEVNGTPFIVEIESKEKTIVPGPVPIISKTPGKVDPIQTPTRKSVASAIKAPLPGNIMKVLVKEGETVKRGDVLLTMESMKMENNILAENDGIVSKIHVQPGQSVMQDDTLIDFDGFQAEVKAQSVAPEASPAPAAPVASQIASAPKSAGTTTVKSPLPGNVLKIAVTVGQAVKRGDVLLTLESMKMENNILAEKDGVIKAIRVQAGQTVMQDDDLVDME